MLYLAVGICLKARLTAVSGDKQDSLDVSQPHLVLFRQPYNQPCDLWNTWRIKRSLSS